MERSIFKRDIQKEVQNTLSEVKYVRHKKHNRDSIMGSQNKRELKNQNKEVAKIFECVQSRHVIIALNS